MKYASASITAHYEGQQAETIDLEDAGSENALVDHLWAVWFGDVPFGDEDDEALADGMPERDDFAGNITFTNPKGFAVHLFMFMEGAQQEMEPVVNFDELLEAWSEADDDRKEAMGEYLDDMGAEDLSDFDEAYEGRYDNGAAFAEHYATNTCEIVTKPSWVAIDWKATWERTLRHDYHITNRGHVFRNM